MWLSQNGLIMSLPIEKFRSLVPPTSVRVPHLGGMILVDDPSQPPRPAQTWKSASAAVSISFVMHVIVLLILSMIFFEIPDHKLLDSILSLVIADRDFEGDEVELDLPEAPELAMEPDEEVPSEEPAIVQDEISPLASVTMEGGSIQRLERSTVPTRVVPESQPTPAKSSPATRSVTKKGPATEAEGQHADHFVARNPATRAALLKRMGGTDASEAAVGRGLVWLKNHQLADGSWNFDHLLNPRCDCTMPGRLSNNPNGATAMALLAFLGAGQTQETGEYQQEVQQGLDFLLAHGTPAEKGICFYGGLQGPPTYYTHGLVTIALSEAFAMTHDPRLRPAIVGGVEFLAATQHDGGGWRYFPGQPGDTSVVAWQLMALKSAQFSRIMVPPRVFRNVERFLSSAASARGSQYAYRPETRQNPTPSMTAAGLLCRMYLDWKENNGALRAGITFLDRQGPMPEDMYYNYYATQVLHHWGGPEWDRWNNVMREHLINTQVRVGHATGSWDVSDRHGTMGGRLYMTTLALLTLEVYYRHLPLYQQDRIQLPLSTPAADDAKLR